MPRRAGRGSRALGLSSTPTPIASALTTPLSSAYPSAYNSENEWDPDHDPHAISISALSLAAKTIEPPAARKAPTPKKPFPFLSLPSELRLKIYGYHFAGTNRVVDLDPTNYKLIHKKLALLRTCRQVYKEASHFFYSTATFRVFPTHPGRFFKTRRPLLSRLSPRQRECITSLELRLGPGWNKPPRSWVISPALGLRGCVNIRRLTVFVECDPSDGFFNGFRRADGFYEGFCRDLLDGVLAEMPWLHEVEFDAWSSVKKSGAMMRGLLEVAAYQRRRVAWGPERGWTDGPDESESSEAVVALGVAGPSGPLGGMGVHGILVVA